MEVREVHYRHHIFPFQPFSDDLFEVRLLLDDALRELLVGLVRAEEEDWCLDEHGKRLPSEQLFACSPWSCPGPDGTLKLLCRFLDLRDGRVMFSAPASYLAGGLYDWMQEKGRNHGDDSA